MGIREKQLLTLGTILISLSGCATCKFQPEGFTSQQISESLSERRRISSNLPMGSPVKLTFYSGQEITGFFYAFNKMNDTIAVSLEPLSLVNRGIPYYLDYISEILPVTPMVAARAAGTPLAPDANSKDIRMVGFKQWPDFQRELLTQ